MKSAEWKSLLLLSTFNFQLTGRDYWRLSEKSYYLTTPIYYVNAAPHVGNAYTTIVADVIARFQRLRGRSVVFATGTDEHAIKVAEAAEAEGLSPKDYVDRAEVQWVQAWKAIGISYDDFIRTTEPRHIKVVQKAFEVLRERGDIFKGLYQGWYCVSDETFFREQELIDGRCPNPECRRPVQWVEEENYYFRLSAYQDTLLEHIEKNPGFLQPDFRKNEVISFIKQGLQDVSVTRANRGWGIPVPGEPDKVIYVWFDALLNYITVAGWESDPERFKKTWPADVQLMAKDIFVRFHSTFWPAMLMGLGVELPRVLYGHGFWTTEGEKISKSKGNAIPPDEVAARLAAMSGAKQEIAVDALRYFMLREVPFGMDGDFSQTSLIHRFNSDLANDLGNLLNRTLSMVGRYFDGVVPEPVGEAPGLKHLVQSVSREAADAFDRFDFTAGLDAIWKVVTGGNAYLAEREPWKLAREGKTDELATVLYSALDTARAATIMLSPFMPTATREMWRQLGMDEDFDAARWSHSGEWGRIRPGSRTAAAEPIFPRVDTKDRKEPQPKPAKEEPAPKQQPEEKYANFDDFKKLQLRIAEIKSAERVPGADKLLKLTVSLGDEERQIVAGIAQWYEPESLVGKKIVLLANLVPAKIRGVESQGMLLAADIDGRAVILTPDSDVPPGSPVK